MSRNAFEGVGRGFAGRFVRGLALAGLLASMSSTAGAATITIDTVPFWNGSNYIHLFGEFNTATYGQVVTVPAGVTQLDSFTFYLDDIQDPDFVDFHAFVHAWDGVKATGAQLFQSGAMSTTNNGGAGGFEAFTVNTGGVPVAAGQEYVLYFSASLLFDGDQGRANWGTINQNAQAPDTQPGGNFVFMNNSNDLSLLTTNLWSQRQGDLAFAASFSDGVVPEPSTALLVGLGLAGLSLRKRRLV